MDGSRFDVWTHRWLDVVVSRRRSLLGMVPGMLFLRKAAVPGLLGTFIPNPTIARKSKKDLKKNAFGCVNIGDGCRGKDGNCCSGICEGKRPKKGKKDKSRCVAHDTGGCQLADDSCAVEGIVPCADGAGTICYRTTGKAGFCGLSFIGACADCVRDTDCESAWGPGAACVVCAGDCAETNNRYCIPSGL